MKTLSKATVTVLVMACILSAQGKQLSPAFRKEAWRALDAIQRVSFSSKRDFNDEQKKLLADAEKAIDEARYARSTPADQEMFRKLNGYYHGLEMQSVLDVSRVVNSPYLQLHYQCEAELLLYFEPEKMDEEGAKKAKQQTCIKQLEAMTKDEAAR